jgi:hypothetical protein
MKTLEEIIKEAKINNDINSVIKELEIYYIKNEYLALIEEHDKFIRVLPKNSMFYVDILENTFDIIDERNYVVLKVFINMDLLKYIEKIWIHKGAIRLIIKDIFSIVDIQNRFKYYNGKILDNINEKMNVFEGDLYIIEFYDKINNEYISLNN